jgi:probable HAF family extracellular repeat protein
MRFPSIRLVRLAVWGAGLLALLAPATPAAAQFIRLGYLPGGVISGAGAISADGSTVVGNCNYGATGAYAVEGFRWTRTEGMVGLGFLPGAGSGGSLAFGVSADGSVIVGGSSSAAGSQAFRWTAASGMVGLGYVPGGTFSGATNVSANGSVVVGFNTVSLRGEEAFRWTQAGGMVGLGDLPGGDFQSSASAASADGSVVVGTGRSSGAFNTEVGQEAFRWTQATGMVGLGELPGGAFYSSARDMTADASVVVGRSASARGFEPFRWTAAGGMVGLGLLPGSTSGYANAVSADGSIIVGVADQSSSTRAFIWNSATGLRYLQDALVNDLGYNLTGWTLTGANDISADGRWVVGTGVNPSGQREAWLANIAPIPEPSSVALAGLGLAGLAGYGWRRRRQQAEGSRQQEAGCPS